MIKSLPPEKIEERSFKLIEERISSHSFNRKEWAIVRRMIHATADFDLVDSTKFHPEAVAQGIAALKGGAPIITDTKMVKVGIAGRRLRRYKTKIICAISHPEVIRDAKRSGKTRAAVAMQKMRSLLGGSIVVIGNAPTALFEVLELAKKASQRPSLVIGVPVGLVGAKESKEMLMKEAIPFITVRGEKGGSPLAVSIINGLSLLSMENRND